MTATLHRISGLHGHGLAAFERAGEIIDEHMRAMVKCATCELRVPASDLIGERCQLCEDAAQTAEWQEFLSTQVRP